MAPIKRSEHIAPLSRDHHHGLLFCWKIKQGLKKNVEPARIHAYVNYFRELHLKTHFSEEETLLFSRLADDPLCNKALEQHQKIMELAGKSSIAAFTALTALMEEHIRFEERVLFPRLEAQLPAATLARIGDRLAALHTGHEKDGYEDEFWR